MLLELSFDLGSRDGECAEDAALGCGACAVTFVDAQDDPVLEPAPGELRLWPATRVRCLFANVADTHGLTRALGAALGIDPALIGVQSIPDRVWEREWLKDFHAMRFGRRLWVCPNHERVDAPEAVVVRLDPGLAFGTGTHASTALCLTWLDSRLVESTVPAEHCRVIDFGCGSGVLGLAAAKLGATEVHAFDIDPQALLATCENARANGVSWQVHVHDHPATLPRAADVLLANILSGPLCALAADFAALLRPGGQVVLSGLMDREAADVTGAYAAWFDVVRCGDREGWVCLVGRRR
jgi:ribosomal protein L11 methyltransferase